MPCTLCKQRGHNKRTCRNKAKAKPEAEAKPEAKPESIQQCCICMEDLQADGKNVCTTKCGHTFCFDCMAQSINANNNACPLCRCELVKRRRIAPRLHEDQTYGIMQTVIRTSTTYNNQLTEYKRKIKTSLESAINNHNKKNKIKKIKKAELDTIYNKMEQELIQDYQRTIYIYGARCIAYTEAHYQHYN